jgi:hypothetical protein
VLEVLGIIEDDLSVTSYTDRVAAQHGEAS